MEVIEIASTPGSSLPVPAAAASSPSPQEATPAQSTSPVSTPAGTINVNTESMTGTINSILNTANQIGGFWNQWGVSASLFILGTFAIVVAFVARATDARLWDDDSFFGALAFALAIYILGFIAFSDKQNRSGQTGQQAVQIYKITVDASLEGQRIAAGVTGESQRTATEERESARPKPQAGTSDAGLKG